jgi:hypothetical protein
VLDELSRRIAKVEKECERLRRVNNRWKWSAFLSISALISAVSCGSGTPDPPKVIEAEAFRLRDSSGKVRAQLAMRPKGGVELVFQDENEEARLAIQSTKDGTPWIGFFDPGEKGRITISVDHDGKASLSVFDKSGNAFTSTSVSGDGNVDSTLCGSDSKPRIGMAVQSDGSASFQIQHKDQKTRMAFGLSTDGSLSQTFLDKTDNQRISVKLNPDGVASQTIYTVSGKGVANTSVAADDAVGHMLMGRTCDSFFIVSIASDGKMVSGFTDKGKPTVLYDPNR